MQTPHNPCPCTHNNYKLHRDEALEIRRLWRTGLWLNEVLAAMFGISKSHVSNIGVGRF